MENKSGPPKSRKPKNLATDQPSKFERAAKRNISLDISETISVVERALDPTLPGDQRAEVVKRVIQLYSGQLPPPEVLERYETLVPGLAEVLVEIIRTEQTEIFALERAKIDLAFADITEAARSKPFALAAFFGVLVVTVIFALLGYPQTGAAICGTAAVAGAAIFLGRRNDR